MTDIHTGKLYIIKEILNTLHYHDLIKDYNVSNIGRNVWIPSEMDIVIIKDQKYTTVIDLKPMS